MRSSPVTSTSTIPPSKRPVRIVGMLRFVFDVQRRCRVDVSTMTPASRQASPTGPPSPPGRSAPVRGDVAPEAGVIGAGTTGGRGVEALCGAAEGVVLVVRPRQVLRALTAGHTFPVPRREGHHSTTAPRAPASGRHASVCGRFRLRGPRTARSTGHDGVIHCAVHAVTRGIAHGNTVVHCVIQYRSGRFSGCAARRWPGPRQSQSRGDAEPGQTAAPRPPRPRSDSRHRSGSRP